MIFKFSLREVFRRPAFSARYILCMGFGILCLALVYFFKLSLVENIELTAKNMLGSDLNISTRRWFSDDEVTKIKKLLGDKKYLIGEDVSALTMLGSDEASQLVRTRWISDGYPFYGTVKLQEKKDLLFSEFKHGAQPICWLPFELAKQYGFKVGDKIKIAEMDFLIDDIILEDPSIGMRFFNLFPTLYLSFGDLKKTVLLQEGATFSHSLGIKFTDGVYPERELRKVRQELTVGIADASIKVSTPQQSQDQANRLYQLLSDYLGLMAVVCLMLGILGAVFCYRSLLLRQSYVWGTYKILGLSERELFLLTLCMHFILAMISLIIPIGFIEIFGTHIASFLQVQLDINLAFPSFALKDILLLAFISFFASFLSTLNLNLKMMKVSELELISDVALHRENKRAEFLTSIPFFMLVTGLSIYFSQSLKIGLTFSVSFAGIWLFLSLFYQVFFKLGAVGLERMKVGRLAAPGESFLVFCFKNLSKRLEFSLSFLICLSLSFILLSYIFILESTFKNELKFSGNKPSYFFFDIQSEELAPLQNFLKEKGVELEGVSSMIRARLLKINNSEIAESKEESEAEYQTREDEDAVRFRNRSVNLTIKDKWSPFEKIVDGSDQIIPWNGATEVSISLEEKYAQRIKAKIGDELTFDIQGVELKARVNALRSVKWLSLYPNFFITFPPGVLEAAPQNFLAVAHDGAKVYGALKELHQKFPSVSVINFEKLMDKVLELSDMISIALKAIGGLGVAVAFLVLFFIMTEKIQHSKNDLIYLHLFGMDERQLFKVTLLENALLCFLCLFVSFLCSWGLGYLSVKFIFDTQVVMPVLSLICLGFGILIMLMILLAFVYWRQFSSWQKKSLFSGLVS